MVCTDAALLWRCQRCCACRMVCMLVRTQQQRAPEFWCSHIAVWRMLEMHASCAAVARTESACRAWARLVPCSSAPKCCEKAAGVVTLSWWLIQSKSCAHWSKLMVRWPATLRAETECAASPWPSSVTTAVLYLQCSLARQNHAKQQETYLHLLSKLCRVHVIATP